MVAKSNATTTIHTMQDDDITCQMVLRYQSDPNCLYEANSFRATRILEIADEVMTTRRMPKTLGEWLAIAMHYGSHPHFLTMRDEAQHIRQGSYLRAERWLRLIDRVHT